MNSLVNLKITYYYCLMQDWAVQYWLSKGCPASKLVLGCALYGRTFTLQDPSKHGLLAPVTGPGQGGEYTRTQGFLASYEVSLPLLCRAVIHSGPLLIQTLLLRNLYCVFGAQALCIVKRILL